MRADTYLSNALAAPDDKIHDQRDMLVWQIDFEERIIKRSSAATKISQEALYGGNFDALQGLLSICHAIAPPCRRYSGRLAEQVYHGHMSPRRSPVVSMAPR